MGARTSSVNPNANRDSIMIAATKALAFETNQCSPLRRSETLNFSKNRVDTPEDEP
jgi:hypothetical protein